MDLCERIAVFKNINTWENELQNTIDIIYIHFLFGLKLQFPVFFTKQNKDKVV